MSPSPDQETLKPRKKARQARSAATVEVIVEAAARILETAGLSGFTTNAIAERAGVSVGSLYQYFPNKDAITRALIRQRLEMLESAIRAVDRLQDVPAPLSRFIAVAVAQQLDRPALAQFLEIEEERLGASVDLDPARERVAVALSEILGVAGRPAGRGVVQDVMALVATLVNAAASREDCDAGLLHTRVEAVVRARLDTA